MLEGNGHEIRRRVYSPDGVCPTLCGLGAGGNTEPKIIVAALKYQRTEYAKKIRKQYEAGEIKERRCNMREYTTRDDGCCNTITTVTKDNYILEVSKS